MYPSLEGSVAVVTGGSKGIGNAIAHKLAASGADIAMCARSLGPLESAANEIEDEYDVECKPIVTDLTDREQTAAFVDEVVDHFGRIDVLVNNAGSAPAGELEGLSEADWYKAIDLKMMGHIRCTTEALPHLVDSGGNVVNVVGINGSKPTPNEMSSVPVNAGDLNFTRAVAMQYGREGVRVNAVSPGPVNTSRWDYIVETIAEENDITFEAANNIAKNSISLGRLAEPEEIANVVAFLASEQASFVNGAVIDIDGEQQKGLMDYENLRIACEQFGLE